MGATTAQLLGSGGILITTVLAVGAFLFGLALWWFGGTEKKLDEIGRVVMISVPLAVFVGVGQYQIGQRQKQRDFELSLTLEHDLSGADLAGRHLTRVRLRGKLLAGANLRGADLNDADLAGTDLTGADLTRAELRNADLRRTKLDRAVLDRADLRSATLKDATLVRANLRHADLRRTNLELANLDSACLAKADLREAMAAGADFSRAILTEADVRRTVFESDLRPARLDQAGLARANYSADTLWPSGFDYRSAVEGWPTPSSIPSVPAPTDAVAATVTEVVAGDNVRLKADPGFEDVLPPPGRTSFIGVDTPEDRDSHGVPVEREIGGQEARQFVQERLIGKRVKVQIGTRSADDPDRIPIYLWLPSSTRSFNEVILENGLGRLRIKADRQLQTQMELAELRAKQRGLGIWAECIVSAPFEPPPLAG